MNRFDLERILLDEGFDPTSIFISRNIHPLDDGLVIYQDNKGNWIAESQERGQRHLLSQARSEDELCQLIYDRFSPKKLREKNQQI